jgi:acyl-CoA synthetase (NDP forming)
MRVRPMNGGDIIRQARATGAAALDEASAKTVLAGFGLAVPRGVTVASAAEAVSRCADLTSPYVVKALCSAPIHKSDVGAIRLGLKDAREVGRAIDDVTAAWAGTLPRLEGFLVEEWVPADHELVIGGVFDRQFGPLVMVGLGGVFVEIFDDIAMRLCPIDATTARQMLRELKAHPILAGARGGRAADEAAVVAALLRLGGADGLLIALADEIAAIDINPLRIAGATVVAADARIVLTREPPRSPSPQRPLPPSFEPLLAPRTVAVAGVSSSGSGAGNRFIDNIRAFGFSGEIYPIHPKADSIAGLTAYRTLASTPREIDYAYVAVPRQAVPELIAGAEGRVRFAQIMTSGFAESGDGVGSQQMLLAAAHRGGARLLGPNSMGTYSPRGRITFAMPASAEAGSISVVSQSGGIGIDLIRQGRMRGLAFRSVVSIGNGVDLGPNDLLAHFLTDPHTDVIGVYLEDIAFGALSLRRPAPAWSRRSTRWSAHCCYSRRSRREPIARPEGSS